MERREVRLATDFQQSVRFGHFSLGLVLSSGRGRERDVWWGWRTSSCFICNPEGSVEAAGPAFEPNVDPLAGFGLSIRDQRRTSNERPMEDNKKDFPRIQQSLFKVPRRKPRNFRWLSALINPPVGLTFISFKGFAQLLDTHLSSGTKAWGCH